MSLEALAQMITIEKLPDGFEALVQKLEEVNTWQEFVYRADSLCWVAYPDPVLNSIERQQGSGNPSAVTTKVCILHGNGAHTQKIVFKYSVY